MNKIEVYAFLCVASPRPVLDAELCREIYKRSEDPVVRAYARQTPVPLVLPLLVAFEVGGRVVATVWEQPFFSMLTGEHMAVSSEEKWRSWVGVPYDEVLHRKYVPAPQHSACICGSVGTKTCSRCMAQRYCGPACQKADWPRHKSECSTASPSKKADLELSRSRGLLHFRDPLALVAKTVGAERAVADRIFARLHEQISLDWVSRGVEAGLKALARAPPPELGNFLTSEAEDKVAFAVTFPRGAKKVTCYLMLARLMRPLNDGIPCQSLGISVTSIYGFLVPASCAAAFFKTGGPVRVSRGLIVLQGQRLYNYVEVVPCLPCSSFELPQFAGAV